MSRISIAGPSISQLEVDYVTQAAGEDWYEGAGGFARRFEQAFARRVGRRHAISLPSCTSALHLALAARGIGPGDEVIVPELTWIATAAPITYVGATPVFADVDPKTWCLCAESVARCISPRTRALIPVDLYGNMPDMRALEALAEAHGLALIEDAAQAIGSTSHGRPAGSFGLASTFSFHGSKTMTTGEGGMLVCDDDELHQRALCLRDHGRQPGDRSFFNAEVGFKYKMGGLQAALGLAQLERLEELVAGKRRLFSSYARLLEGVEGLTLNTPGPEVESSYWMVTALMDASIGLDKDQLMDRLDQVEIDSRPMFHPLSSLPAYRQYPGVGQAPARNPHAYALGPRGINLPSALRLVEADIERVCEQLRRILRAAS